MDYRNNLLSEVLLNSLQNEYDRIERAKAEIIKIRQELNDIGWVGPDEATNQPQVAADQVSQCGFCGRDHYADHSGCLQAVTTGR